MDKELVPHEDFDDVRNLLLEAVAETSEEAMEKFFNGEDFTEEEIKAGSSQGVINGDVVPVLVGSAANLIGVHTLFDMMFNYMPTPEESRGGVRYGTNPDTGEKVERIVSTDEPFSAFVFKTIVDPFIGKISLFKVVSGSLTRDMEIKCFSGKKRKNSKSLFCQRY